jgi:adenylate kinase family enzyme
MPSFPYKRIVVVGVTGSGKSTLAETLANKFGYDFIELDALHWEPNWTEAPLDVFHARVECATASQSWVLAGNYRIVRDIVWSKAEAVVWLDYSFPLIFGRLWRRTWRRWWYQEALWNGNRESIWTHFKLWSKDSLFHWIVRTYWKRRREYPVLFSLPEHQHLNVIRFGTPEETDTWLRSI